MPTNQRAGIVGVWQVTIQIQAMPQAFEGLYTFFADGNFVEANSLKETNAGVWTGAGPTYQLTFWSYLFDAQGQANGKARVRAALQMEGADRFSGQGMCDTFDQAGQVTEHLFAGPFELAGVRVRVE